MRIQAVLIVLIQIAISIWIALYMVFHSVSYIGLAPAEPPPWRNRILPWVLHFLMSLTGFRVDTAMLALFGVYSGILFLVLQYAIVRPILRSRPN